MKRKTFNPETKESMEYRNQKNTVIYRNRKATFMGYFDTLCLLFDTIAFSFHKYLLKNVGRFDLKMVKL